MAAGASESGVSAAGVDPGLPVPGTQKPVELILARNLISSLSTPAFLVDEGGVLVFYNEAAGSLLGRRYEEVGSMGPDQWGMIFGPVTESGDPFPYDELPLVQTVRQGRPAHAKMQIRAADGAEHRIEVVALPILTTHGSQGGIAFFWPVADQPRGP